MADRDWIKNQSAGRITTTNTAYQDALTATGTPTNGSKDFWLLASAIVDKSAATTDVLAKLIDSTGAADLCVWNLEPHDTTDKMPVFGLAKWTSPSSPGSQSFKLQYAVETSGTSGIAEMCINAIESHADDEYIETDGEITTTSATYQDAQDLTFTPYAAGDYLIIGYAEYNNSSVSTGRVKLLIDGVDSFEVSPYELTDATNYVPFMAANKVTLTAASHTIKIQYRSNGTATAAIRRRRVLAIRLDTLRANSSDFTAARGTTASTTAVDAASTTFTAEASVNYLAIGNAVMDGNSTTISTNAQVSMDGAVVSLYTVEPQSTTSERVYAAMNYSTFAAGSRTIKTQVFSETASITTGYAERGIYVLDLRELTPTSKSASDSLLPKLTETAALLAALAQSDSVSPKLTETSANALTSDRADTLLPKLTETSTNLLASDRADTIFPRLDDTSAVTVVLAILDTLLPRLDDAAAVSVLVALADTLLPKLTEASANALTSDRSDILLPKIDETSATQAGLVAADSLLPKTTETSVNALLSSLTDTLLPKITDTAALLGLLERVDTLAVLLAEIADVVPSGGGGPTPVNVSDTLLPKTVEALAIIVQLARTDTLSPMLAEAVALLSIVATSDTLRPKITEALDTLVVLARADTLTPKLTETVALLSLLSRADTLLPLLTDVSAVAGVLTVSDTLLPMTAETAAIVTALGRALLAGIDIEPLLSAIAEIYPKLKAAPEVEPFVDADPGTKA